MSSNLQSIQSILCLVFAGAFVGMGLFFGFVSVLASRDQDSTGGCLGRTLALMHILAAIVLIIVALIA